MARSGTVSGRGEPETSCSEWHADGMQMAWPVRTTALGTWCRRQQLGRWVRPIQGDTSLVGKAAAGGHGSPTVGRCYGAGSGILRGAVAAGARLSNARTSASLCLLGTGQGDALTRQRSESMASFMVVLRRQCASL